MLKLYPKNNPLFDIEARSLRWGATWPVLRQRSIRWGGWMLGTGVGLWILLLLVEIASSRNAYNAAWDMIGLLFFVSLADKLVLDFIAVSSALDSISRDIQTGRWDLIAISDLRTREIIHAKHALAQLRAWRVTVVVIALRLTVVLLVGLTTFALPLIYPPDVTSLNPYRDLNLSTLDEYILFFFALVVAAEVAGIYLLEPLWRLRALSAASIAISARQHAPGFAMLAAFGAFVGVWASQIIIALAAAFMLGFTTFAYFSGITAGMCMAAYILGIGLMIYSTYSSMTSRWLNRANRHLVNNGGTP